MLSPKISIFLDNIHNCCLIISAIIGSFTYIKAQII